VRHRGNSGPPKAKPPYDGGLAFRMGWPCVAPYQLKRAKKFEWHKAWLFAQDPGRFFG
jgi:hypothetical protein